MNEKPALVVAQVAIRGARIAVRMMPAGLKRRIDDGIFHYIFQKTRVENDAYGWRPDTPGGGEPPPGVDRARGGKAGTR
jgi:hypothetical protein